MPSAPERTESRDTLVGHRILYYDAVESTNDTAKALLGEGADEGTVVVASRQVAGRGRHGRAWFSPPGGLYLSIVLRPEPSHVQTLGLLSGMPVVKALRHVGVLGYLKWPNDVVFQERKIGGILSEGVHRDSEFYAIVGIGVNTNIPKERFPEEFRDRATSIRAEVPMFVANEEFLDYFLPHYDELYRRFRSGSRDWLVKEYRGLCRTLKREVEVDTGRGKVRGVAYDITPTGSLVVMDREGRRTEVSDGTVAYLP